MKQIYLLVISYKKSKVPKFSGLLEWFEADLYLMKETDFNNYIENSDVKLKFNTCQKIRKNKPVEYLDKNKLTKFEPTNIFEITETSEEQIKSIAIGLIPVGYELWMLTDNIITPKKVIKIEQLIKKFETNHVLNT